MSKAATTPLPLSIICDALSWIAQCEGCLGITVYLLELVTRVKCLQCLLLLRGGSAQAFGCVHAACALAV